MARTGRKLRLAPPQELLASERTHATDAVAGDVVGLHDRGDLRVGDTLSVEPLVFPGVPRFSPEQFALVRIENPLRRKHLDKGLRHLAEEGTILLLFSESMSGPIPIVGVVGRLQFDVLVHRLESEYGVQATLQPLSFTCARWVTGPEEAIRSLAGAYGARLVEDAEGHAMVLFETEWSLGRAAEREPRISFSDAQPTGAVRKMTAAR